MSCDRPWVSADTPGHHPSLFPDPLPCWQSPSLAQVVPPWPGQGIVTWPVTQFWPTRNKKIPFQENLLALAKKHRLSNVPLSDSQCRCVRMWALICHHLGTRRGTHHHGGRQSKKVERSGFWWHHGRHSTNQLHSPPTPTPRSGGCETMCPPGHYARLPITRSWKHSNTLKSRSRCNLTKGAHFVNWLNTCQNVSVQWWLLLFHQQM